MTDERLLAQVDDLRSLPAETPWAEFKEANADPQRIGELISGIANSARLADRDFGYVVWGVRDRDHAVTGTSFEPSVARSGNERLEIWLARMVSPSVAFFFHTLEHPDGRVVLLEIPAASNAPVEFKRMAYIRIGSSTTRLSGFPDRQRVLWDKLRPYAWERGVARQFVAADDVLDLLDWASYFALTGMPAPSTPEAILVGLASDRLISQDVGARWNVHNLGAILFARELHRFDSSLARKAVRFVAYDGEGRTATVTHREDFPLGYANGFDRLNTHINLLVPAPENGETPIRNGMPLFPPVAVRELAANALIHQDMTLSGAGPTIELFRNRLEITNPGAPLIEAERFIDSPPRSRNEALAALMRRMGLCEEQGTGIDKVVEASEKAQLPPPEFRAEAEATRVSLFGPRRFAEMTAEERLRACYQHAVLRHLSGQQMRNETLRKRLGVESHNTAQVSKVIRQALDEKLVRPADPARPRSGYVPFWA